MDKRVTIEDISREAGVGKGTVDRVLHNRGYVSEETRQKVLQCIEKLGYQPNIAARALAKKTNYKVAVIYHDSPKQFWSQIEKGLDRAIAEYEPLGITIDKFVLEQLDPDKQLDFIQQAITEGYHGIVIVPYHSQQIKDAINRAVEHGIHVITLNNDEACDRDCYIGQDMYMSGMSAGKLVCMIADQHSRCLTILPQSDASMISLEQRYLGFKKIITNSRQDIQLSELILNRQDNLSLDAIYKKVVQRLQQTEVQTVYVSYAIMEPVAQAVVDLQLQNRLFLLGHDMTEPLVPYVKNNVIQILINQEPEKQGYEAINRMCRCLAYDESITGDLYTKTEIMIAENMSL